MANYRVDKLSAWNLKSKPSRALRVLVDRDSLPVLPELLELILEESGADVEQYRDNGPPDDAPRTHPDSIAEATAIGWVTVRERGDNRGPFRGRLLTTASETSVTSRFVSEVMIESLRAIRDHSGLHYVSDESLLLFAVARELEVDLLITARADLLATPFASGQIPVRSASAAIPIAGLYMRSAGRGVLVVGQAHKETIVPASTFFSRVIDEYLPLLDTLERHFSMASLRQESDLVVSLRRKLGFALIRRDAVWRMTLQHPTYSQLDEMAAEVDSFLLFLTSALDATARLLDLVAGLNSPRNRLGFQQRDWRQRAAQACSLRLSEQDINVVAAITGLRNFTHSTGTRSVPVGVGNPPWRKTTTYVHYEKQESASKDNWRDPIEAFVSLQDSHFFTPAVDVRKFDDSADVFLTPGPMCDVLAGGGMAIVDLGLQAISSMLDVTDAATESTDSSRAEVRNGQIRALFAVPGFGDFEHLA